MQESHLRSILKGISWRIIGTLDTIFLSFIVQLFPHLLYGQAVANATSKTQMASNSVLIGIVEFCTKILLFYVHERIWLAYLKDKSQTKAISLVKAFTWRLTGSLDTMLWSGLILSDFRKGAAIGLLEVFTKIILYYFHERAWHRLPLGTVRNWLRRRKSAP